MTPSHRVLGLVSVLVIAAAGACSNTDAAPPAPVTTADASEDAMSESDASIANGEDAEADAGLSGICADSFGDKLTAGFGRIDGVVYAVQKPTDTQCAMPNDDHVIVQVLMDGAVYRMVTNVESTGADPDVRFTTLAHALPDPVWSEGWHDGVALDYPTTLGIHNDAFTSYGMDELVTKITDRVKVGAKVSVYAESGSGRPESAHNIHRSSKKNQDGAIVVDPTGAPTFLLFHFDEQTF